eukprot:jgi/Hompol1/2311/HPOL_001970-RA
MSQFAVEATGFQDSVSSGEVTAYFSRFGAVKTVQLLHGPKGKCYMIEFDDFDSMVKVLAAEHVYEDCVVQARAKSKGNATSMPTIKASATSYTPNTVVEFQLNSDTETLTGLAIRILFEKFAAVKNIEFVPGHTLGHVEFKAAVAKEIIGIIAHAGGIRIEDEAVALRHLEGEEERLYWAVAHERQKTRPNPVKKLTGAELMKAAALAKEKADKLGRKRHSKRITASKLQAKKATVRYHKLSGDANPADKLLKPNKATGHGGVRKASASKPKARGSGSGKKSSSKSSGGSGSHAGGDHAMEDLLGVLKTL